MAYTIAVAQYGHISFKVKHWAIIVLSDERHGLAYQITGSTTTYELKEVEFIDFTKHNSERKLRRKKPSRSQKG